MNNPLRFAGETLYQTNYLMPDRTGREGSAFQVVKNSGWMLPYVACMIVVVGMAAQFFVTLSRFVGRRAAAHQHDVGSFRREAPGNGCADACASAGDEGGLAFESHRMVLCCAGLVHAAGLLPQY